MRNAISKVVFKYVSVDSVRYLHLCRYGTSAVNMHCLASLLLEMETLVPVLVYSYTVHGCTVV